jgi:hypothetical protein
MGSLGAKPSRDGAGRNGVKVREGGSERPDLVRNRYPPTATAATMANVESQ